MKRAVQFALLFFVFALVPAPPLPAQEGSSENPVAEIAGDMSAVVRDLSKLSTGKPTQETQKQIVAKLDDLIKQLEQD